MDFKIIITQAAVNDLEEIVAFISSNDPRAAHRVADDLVRRAESLAQMPRRGKALRARQEVRRLFRNPYLIIYRIDEVAKVVTVLRFWHGGRNPKSLRLD